MNYRALIARHYPTDSPLRRLLLLHSGQVCRRALDIARRHPELGADLALTETFLRMGVDELSVNPVSVLPLRKIIRGIDLRKEPGAGLTDETEAVGTTTD